MQVGNGGSSTSRALSSASASTPTPAASSQSQQDRTFTRPGVGLKRSYSQQATAAVPTTDSPVYFDGSPGRPHKLQRPADNTNHPSPFSAARRGRTSRGASPQPSSAKTHESSSKRGGNRQTANAEAGPSTTPSSHKKNGKGSKRGGKRGKGSRTRPPKPVLELLESPWHDEAYIKKEHNKNGVPLRGEFSRVPKSPLHNFYSIAKDGASPIYTSIEGTHIMDDGAYVRAWRTTVELDIEPKIVGVGDHKDKKESANLAALSAVYQLHELQLLESPRLVVPKSTQSQAVSLSDGSVINFETARSFMDYYCRRFQFPNPVLHHQSNNSGSLWETTLSVNDRKIGMGAGSSKKLSLQQCYLDVTKYLEECDPQLWQDFAEAAKTGKDLGLAPSVLFTSTPYMENMIEDLCHDIGKSALYHNRPRKTTAPGGTQQDGADRKIGSAQDGSWIRREVNKDVKERFLRERRQAYLGDPKMKTMRDTRAKLPVYTQARKVLDHVEKNEVTICLAATGSGKTTQIPQMILDDWIDKKKGASCNIICTQPRRLAAISVAHRVAAERGEALGSSVGYHVRFESKIPEPNGSVTFATTGIFLKRLQSMLAPNGDLHSDFDSLTHVVVDEVHERDIDTDLLLVVLKQLMALKRARGQELKIILMSATIDPTLFKAYFPDKDGKPAGTIEIPGRSYPVTKHYMEDYAEKLLKGPMNWVAKQDPESKYLVRELGPAAAARLGVLVGQVPENIAERNDLELPYSFIAATISHVLNSSDDGHVLVFLPGWEEIIGTQRALLTPKGPLGIDFNSQKYSLHLLHSSIPLPEQQAIFSPPEPGVRRIILATNIAETSVTIPDVVYVIDSARIKEQQYEPNKHITSLVMSWVGTSNLNQRAGRAGRHRSGEYFGILGKQRAETLPPHQTVEMKRVDLSAVVMHVKALNLPGMSVEEVLAATIEPPETGRVEAAIRMLQTAGALDADKELTSLGRVLLQLPVDVQVGKMVLYGCFFRCLDSALTLAAIQANREPFLAPMHLRNEAARAKNSFVPEHFPSDLLAALNGFNAWWEMQSRGEYVRANRFCQDNFLSKPTLLMIQKVRMHILQALYREGIIQVSAGGEMDPRDVRKDSNELVVPRALSVHNDSMPLMLGLIATAAQPKFALKSGAARFRTETDKMVMMHPSSVNHRKHEAAIRPETDEQQSAVPIERKTLYSFLEKRRNATNGSGGTTNLVGTTRIDPLVYILFGAYNVEVVHGGLECDGWLPIKAHYSQLQVLDDLWRLKNSVDASMLRVFEGIIMGRRKGRRAAVMPRAAEELEEWEGSDDESSSVGKDYSLSRQEMRDLDEMTSSIVSLLNAYSDDRIWTQSRATSRTNSREPSRTGTPSGSPLSGQRRLPPVGPSRSGFSTPYQQSRPGTPSRLRY